MSLARFLLVVGLLLAVAKATESIGVATHGARESEAAPSKELQVLDRISFSARQLVADLMWLRVDSYMHHGVGFNVAKTGEKDISLGVSYRFNPEVVPLMKLVTLLDPTFVTAGGILGVHLITDRDRLDEGTQLLKHLIERNPDHPRIYHLYGELGRALWIRNLPTKALPYLMKAVDLYPRVRDAAGLRRVGDRPMDSRDDLFLRSYLAAIVSSAIACEDYELALKYWRQQPEWSNSHNVEFQLLVAYMRQKQAGTVDREELALLRREYMVKQQDYMKSEEAAHPAKQFPKEFEEAIHQSTQKKPDGENQRQRIDPTTTRLELTISEGRWKKLAGLLVLLLMLVLLGRTRGWLLA